MLKSTRKHRLARNLIRRGMKVCTYDSRGTPTFESRHKVSGSTRASFDELRGDSTLHKMPRTFWRHRPSRLSRFRRQGLSSFLYFGGTCTRMFSMLRPGYIWGLYSIPTGRWRMKSTMGGNVSKLIHKTLPQAIGSLITERLDQAACLTNTLTPRKTSFPTANGLIPRSG